MIRGTYLIVCAIFALNTHSTHYFQGRMTLFQNFDRNQITINEDYFRIIS